jgi:hypothetical protein
MPAPLPAAPVQIPCAEATGSRCITQLRRLEPMTLTRQCSKPPTKRAMCSPSRSSRLAAVSGTSPQPQHRSPSSFGTGVRRCAPRGQLSPCPIPGRPASGPTGREPRARSLANGAGTLSIPPPRPPLVLAGGLYHQLVPGPPPPPERPRRRPNVSTPPSGISSDSLRETTNVGVRAGPPGRSGPHDSTDKS